MAEKETAVSRMAAEIAALQELVQEQQSLLGLQTNDRELGARELESQLAGSLV